MQRVKKLGAISAPSKKGINTKPPHGYFSLADVSKHVSKRVELDFERIKQVWRGDHWSSDDEFKQAILAYLVEYLIWQFKVPENGHGSWAICLWYKGSLFEFGAEGKLSNCKESETPSLDDFLYKDNFSVLDFVGRENNPLLLSSEYDETIFAEFASTRRSGHDFIDLKTWSVCCEPKIDLSSFEAFLEHSNTSDFKETTFEDLQTSTIRGGELLKKESWPSRFSLRRSEYEMVMEAWSRVQPFSEAQLVCRGRSASKIADRTITELKRFYLRDKLPSNKDWRRQQARWAADNYLGLSADDQDSFAKKPKEIFAEWITGNGKASDHRSVKDDMWEEFLANLPPCHRKKLYGRGRRSGS